MIHGCRKPHSARTSGKPMGRTEWPIVITMEKSGKEKKWGPLSRTAAWKAGCFWEEKGDVKVFLEKGGEKKEVSVEKLVGEDGPRFWFQDRKPDPPKQQVEERKEDQSVTEDRLTRPPRKRWSRSRVRLTLEMWRRARQCDCRRRSLRSGRRMES